MDYAFDQLDLKILRELNKNARRSFRDIAKQLGISIGTVSNRIRKLEEMGLILGYAPVISPERLGCDLMAIIGVKISSGKLLEVQKLIAKDPRVFGVFDVTGEWDSIVMARFKNPRELDQFVKSCLSLENVERTYTQVVLNIVKDERRVLV